MQLIRCTAKLRKEMGITKSNLSTVDPQEGVLGQWHANLIHINRKKCVLFVNDKTLTNFLIPDIPRSKIRTLSELFYSWLGAVLAAEGYTKNQIELLRNEYNEIGYAASNSRKILGNMNDLAFHYEVNIQSSGGIHSAEFPDIIKKLNRMPMDSTKDCKWPYQELRSVIKGAI